MNVRRKSRLTTLPLAGIALATVLAAALAAAVVASPDASAQSETVRSSVQLSYTLPPNALKPERERARIRAHLLGAERILVSADVSHLTEAQRERRARAIALLREYRRAGVFPHNHDFPGERVPYFVDRHGTLCAMAYLIARTGGEEIVARVARTANNAYVAELAGDRAFRRWLDRHGMTVAEAARVQPSYGCCTVEPPPETPDMSYELASVGTAAVSGAAIALQLEIGRAHV